MVLRDCRGRGIYPLKEGATLRYSAGEPAPRRQAPYQTIRLSGHALASDDKEILLDGWSGEPCCFRCPREDPFNADYQTAMVALVCNIYFIMMGHAFFPDIIDGEDRWYLKVEERFENGLFSDDEHACSHITHKCFRLQYDSADEIVRDTVTIEEGVAAAGHQQQDKLDALNGCI